MIDHLALYVSDIQQSRRFYEQALEPLGYRVLMDSEGFVALGPDELQFALRTGKEASTTAHFAFRADDRPTVDAFHAAATGAGGTDAGKPGIREHYHENYYAAFVEDPDGNNVEAVCHKPA